VFVDVYPARDSAPVADLAAGDVRISEHAARQTVATFEPARLGDVERARYNQDESRTYPGIGCVAQPALRPVSISYRTSMVFGVACPQRSSVQGLQGGQHIRATSTSRF